MGAICPVRAHADHSRQASLKSLPPSLEPSLYRTRVTEQAGFIGLSHCQAAPGGLQRTQWDARTNLHRLAPHFISQSTTQTPIGANAGRTTRPLATRPVLILRAHYKLQRTVKPTLNLLHAEHTTLAATYPIFPEQDYITAQTMHRPTTRSSLQAHSHAALHLTLTKRTTQSL